MPEPKILVSADLHLGRASAWLRGPEAVDPRAVGAWERLVAEAARGGATAVALAGDVFDGMAAYYETRTAFLRGLHALRSRGIAAVAVAGNHDHEALPRFARQYPDSGLTVLGLGGAWEAVERGGATFVGWSFPSETVRTRAFDALLPQAEGPTVGLVHGDLDPKSLYHPVAPADVAVGAWVLGHIHKPQRVGPTALYPGSPQALDFGPGERGAHGFHWLAFPNGRPEFSPLQPLSTVRFEEVELEVAVTPGEDPFEATMAAAEAHADALRAEQPGLESVQLRLRVVLKDCARPFARPAEAEARGDDAFLFTEAPRIRLGRSPWSDVGGGDLADEVARLLLGATADPQGLAEGRPVERAWVEAAETLVRRGADDVLAVHRTTIARALDVGDGARPAPSLDEARRIARLALVSELEGLRA